MQEQTIDIEDYARNLLSTALSTYHAQIIRLWEKDYLGARSYDPSITPRLLREACITAIVNGELDQALGIERPAQTQEL